MPAPITTSPCKCPELGSVARRGHFPTTWFFDCTCSRCSSPTELGSHLSSLLCPLQAPTDPENQTSCPKKESTSSECPGDSPEKLHPGGSCPGGLLTPSFPTEYNSPWTCNSCSFTISSCLSFSRFHLTEVRSLPCSYFVCHLVAQEVHSGC